jgi:hypothetical protein
MHFSLLNVDDTRNRYNELLQDAEDERRYRRIKKLNASPRKGLHLFTRKNEKDRPVPLTKPAFRAK